MAQFKELHQQIDEGRRRVSKLEDVVRVFKQSSEKTPEQLSSVNGSKLASQLGAEHESEPVINDLNIKYWGLIQAGHWLIKSFDHSQMILESIKGQQMTILLEK
jgi:hypothetical protein